MEYAWDMSWCDPCAAEPLRPSELRELGVMWLDDAPEGPTPRGMAPSPVDVFVTRLHLRYDAKTFPEDLTFEITGDRENYQGRYVLRHPWRGDYTSCSAASEYASSLVERWDAEAVALAKLTGWDVNDIRDKMADGGYSAAAVKGVDLEKPVEKKSWWSRLWGNG